MNKKNFLTILKDVAAAAALALLVLYFVQPTIVRQSSMEDTFYDGDYLLVSRQAYALHEPKRGDIVVFKVTLNEDGSPGKFFYIKRIIGLPGDEIKIADGSVYVNGGVLNEPYIDSQAGTDAYDLPEEGKTVTVPEGKYYVLGDNREVSQDSRFASVGFVSQEKFLGKVFLRLFPFSRMERF